MENLHYVHIVPCYIKYIGTNSHFQNKCCSTIAVMGKIIWRANLRTGGGGPQVPLRIENFFIIDSGEPLQPPGHVTAVFYS